MPVEKIFFASPREKAARKSRALEEKSKMAEYAELAPFGVRVPGQNYALVSFVSPESAQRSPMSGFRIYGCFETMEEAKAHAEKANRADDAFDIYVAEMYRWCPWYPNPMDVQDPVYSDPQLDTMLREHRAAQVSAQTAFDERVAGALKEKASREDREEREDTGEEALREDREETGDQAREDREQAREETEG